MMKTAIIAGGYYLVGDTMENLIIKLKALCNESRLKIIAILAGRELCAATW